MSAGGWWMGVMSFPLRFRQCCHLLDVSLPWTLVYVPLSGALLVLRLFAVLGGPGLRPSPPPRRCVAHQVARGDRRWRRDDGGGGVSLALLPENRIRGRSGRVRSRQCRIAIPPPGMHNSGCPGGQCRISRSPSTCDAVSRHSDVLVAEDISPRSYPASGGGGGGGGSRLRGRGDKGAAVADFARTETPPPIAGRRVDPTDCLIPPIPRRRR